MNKADKFRIIQHGHSMLLLWKRLNDEAEEVAKRPDWPAGKHASWYKYETRQAYHDALYGMRNLGLIESYNVVSTKIQLDGIWYGLDDIPSRYRKRFVRGRATK